MRLQPVASALQVRTVSRFDPLIQREVEVDRQVSRDGFTPSTQPLPDGQPFCPDGPPGSWKVPDNACFLAEQTTL